MRPKHLVPYAAVLLALSGAAACGASTPTTGPAGAAASSPKGPGAAVGSDTGVASDTGPVAKTLAVTITGTTVTPAPAQIDLPVGQTLELTVTSDHDDELHAHGFEAEATLKAGVPATVTLTGTEAGVYEVETHHPALTLLTVAVR